jgi:hypothetical protein
MSKTQWYAKSAYLLVILALVLSLWVVAVPMRGTVGAGVLVKDYYVSTTGSDANNGTSWTWAWKTITYAVQTGATTSGDVIHVADGVYDPANGENFPIDFNTNGVSLIGAGGDTSIIDANNLETNILNIWADGVSISDFELRNARAKYWGSTGNGIYMGDVDDCDISNFKIYNLTEGTSHTREPAGIFMEDGSDDNTFSSIEIYDISSCSVARGIWCHNCSGNQFTAINIHDVSVSNSCLSEFAVFGIHLSSSDGNTFDEITIDDITGGDWAEGIELQQSNGNTFGDLSISDVYGEWYAYGIKLGDSSDNTFGSSSEIWNINAACPPCCGIGVGVEKDPSLGSNRNTFESFDIHDTCYGFYISKSSDNFIIKSNIHDNLRGVSICSNISQSVGNKVNCNNIYRNTDYGVFKLYSPDVDATGNWWGDAHGPSHSPGNGDEISDNVLYDPYLSFQFQYCGQCGGTLPPPASAVPTVNHWGMVAMISLFAGLLVWSVRRRRLAS